MESCLNCMSTDFETNRKFSTSCTNCFEKSTGGKLSKIIINYEGQGSKRSGFFSLR